MKKILLSIFILSASLIAQSKIATTPIDKENIIYKSKLDSLSIAYENLQKEVAFSKTLIETLEKTNQQISLWSNPYGVFIAALGVLFTVMTFFFAGFFYLQSKEFKERINKLISSHQTALNKLIEDWTERKSQIDKQIEENQSKILKTTDKQKLDELEKIVEKLKIERNSIKFPLGISYGGAFASGSILGESRYGSLANSGIMSGVPGTGGPYSDIIKCVSCNSTFAKPVFPEIITSDGKRYTKCPYCSTDNQC